MSGAELARAAAVAHHRLVGVVLVAMGGVGVTLGAGFHLAGNVEHVDGPAMIVTALLLGAAGGWQLRYTPQ